MTTNRINNIPMLLCFQNGGILEQDALTSTCLYLELTASPLINYKIIKQTK